MAYHIHEPLGVVGQIIPWNFPILMAAWKLALALGAGNCVVLKPAESTPISILILADLIADLLPPGVLNIVNGLGRETGMPLATSKRIAKIAFTGSTATGRVIAQAAANNLIPATWNWAASRPTSSFRRHHGARTMPSSTRPSKAWCCSPSTRAKCNLPEPRADPGIHLRQVHRARAQARAAIKQGSPSTPTP